jgi:hypothetical protein
MKIYHKFLGFKRFGSDFAKSLVRFFGEEKKFEKIAKFGNLARILLLK